MMDLFNAFQTYLKSEQLLQPHHRLLVAVSGGVDSVVLCHLCQRAGIPFDMAHANFQLRGDDSFRDEAFVLDLAQQWQVPFHRQRFSTQETAIQQQQSIELTAREQRYTWLYGIINDLNQQAVDHREPQRCVLATAHHADDNVETMMMHFFRGTGIRGLRGILPKQEQLIRPILFARKFDLLAYAEQEQLAFVVDHTNAENDFTRNYFRNVLIPSVQEKFPGVAQNLQANLLRFRETEILYQQALQLHIKKLVEHRGVELHLPVLKWTKAVPQNTLMHEVLAPYGFTAHQVPEALQLLQSSSGKYICSASHRLFRNRNWLVLSPLMAAGAEHILVEAGTTSVSVDGDIMELKTVEVSANSIPKGDNNRVQVDARYIVFPLLLRKWKTGDYFYPLGMQKKKKMSRFFIDQKLSLSEKERIWVLTSNERIVWVIGHRIDDRFKLTAATTHAIELKIRHQSE